MARKPSGKVRNARLSNPFRSVGSLEQSEHADEGGRAGGVGGCSGITGSGGATITAQNFSGAGVGMRACFWAVERAISKEDAWDLTGFDIVLPYYHLK